jgi:hypothetical protein
MARGTVLDRNGSMTDEAFLAAFERCELTKGDWTHAAHVRVGWLFLAKAPSFEIALARVRLAIQRFNLTVLDKPTGYHETITHAFLRLILARCAECAATDFAVFRSKNLDLFDSQALAKHYSKDVLGSPQARREFVPPDLEPLPEIAGAPDKVSASSLKAW